MKHGIKLRKLQRTSSHRQALLRNLVSALLHHEAIKTTVPKAKEAARMAEKIITLGKRRTDPAKRKAQAYLMPPHHYGASTFPLKVPYPTPPAAVQGERFEDSDPEAFIPPASLLPKLFTTLADRYADRPGGYTRIHRFGKRPGDNAPVAILALVDGPRDLKFEMSARAVGRELASMEEDVDWEDLESVKEDLRPRTQRAMTQAMQFRSEEDKARWKELMALHKLRLESESEVVGHRRDAKPSPHAFYPPSLTRPSTGRIRHAGERLPGMDVSQTGLGLARGVLGRNAPATAPKARFAREKVVDVE